MIDFKLISIEDKDLLNKYLDSRCNKNLCDYNFVNLAIWAEIYNAQWAMFKDTLIIYNGKDDIFLMPSGCNIDSGRIITLSEEFFKSGYSGNFTLVEKNFVESHRIELEKYFEITEDLAFADYIYSVEKLVALKGKKLQKKKNLVNQFIKNKPDYKVLKLEKNLFPECFKIAEEWCASKNCEKIGFSHEKSALGKAFDNCDELNIDGLSIFVQNKMIAFSIFSRMNEEMYDIHFEKFNSDIKGAGQIINFETAKYLQDKCKFVNREQDLGLEGLRQAKLSYDPEMIILTCRLIRK